MIWHQAAVRMVQRMVHASVWTAKGLYITSVVFRAPLLHPHKGGQPCSRSQAIRYKIWQAHLLQSESSSVARTSSTCTLVQLLGLLLRMLRHLRVLANVWLLLRFGQLFSYSAVTLPFHLYSCIKTI